MDATNDEFFDPNLYSGASIATVVDGANWEVAKRLHSHEDEKKALDFWRKAAAQDGAKQNEAPEGASEGATAERAAAAGQEVPGRSKQGKKGPRRGKPPKGKAQQAGSQQGRNPKGKPHHGGRGRKPQEKQPDPNSPFAVLKELKFGG